MAESLTRNWRWVALRGAVAILFGALTLFTPGITLAVLIYWFGAYVLVDGVFMIVVAIARREGEPRWATLLIGGLVAIALGITTFFLPALTAFAILMFIAAWAIVTGIAEIVAAVRLRKVIRGEWLFVLAGVLSIAFGVLLVIAPGAGALVVLIWIGSYALVTGVLLLALGFRLRSWGRAHAMSGTPHPA